MSYPPADFAYAVTPTVVPYTIDSGHITPVTLLITVNNPAAKFVACSRLVFDLPAGSGAGDLTNNPTTIAATPALGVPWSITADMSGVLTAVPNAGTSGIGPGDSIAFLIANIQVNGLPGLAIIDVWEQTDQLGHSRLDVSKAPPGLAITSFTANPIQISAGDSTTLSWTTTGAQTCTVSWAGGSKTDLDVDGTLPVSPEITTTYTLTATSTPTQAEGTALRDAVATAQVTVYVPQVQILSFSASPREVPMGGKSTLHWLVLNADTCMIGPGDHNVDPNTGSLEVELTESTRFDLEADGFGRTVGMPTRVKVLPVTINSFTATPSEVVPGAASTLTWDTSGSLSPWVIDGLGTVSAIGSQPVTPSQDTTYRLHPQPGNDPHASAAVVVAPGFVSLQGQGNGDGSFNLSYSTAGAPSIHAQTPGPVNRDYPSQGEIDGIRIGIIMSVNGSPLRNRVQAAIASRDVGRGNVHSVSVECDAGLHAVGGTATVTWNYESAEPQGEISVTTNGTTTTTQLKGGTGQQTFVIGDEWTACFYADSSRYPACALLKCFPAS